MFHIDMLRNRKHTLLGPQAETRRDVHIDDDIKGSETSQILDMLESFYDILTDIPGSTNATQHVINVSITCLSLYVSTAYLCIMKMQLKQNLVAQHGHCRIF